MNTCVPCWDKQKPYEWKHVEEVFSIASRPPSSSRTAEGNADQTLQCAARERWAEQREEALCASDALLQKKNEDLKDVLWGRVISRSSNGSLGVSAVTRYAYSTGSPGVCKFLFLSHIWSCFLRLCLLFRSLSRSGGGEPKTFGSCLTQSDETRRGRGGWNYSWQLSLMSIFHTRSWVRIGGGWWWLTHRCVKGSMRFRMTKTSLQQWPCSASAGCSCAHFLEVVCVCLNWHLRFVLCLSE